MTTQQVSEPALARHTVWSVVRGAVRGVPHDYTSGSIGRAIVLLAIAMVLEMAMPVYCGSQSRPPRVAGLGVLTVLPQIVLLR